MIQECFAEMSKLIEENRESMKDQKMKHVNIKIDVTEYYLEFLMDLFGVESEKMRMERNLRNKLKCGLFNDKSLNLKNIEVMKLAARKPTKEELLKDEMNRALLRKRFS